jgi:hypothetical protein
MDEEKKGLRHLELSQIPQVAWQLLREGVDSARSPLHTPCLATTGEHGPSLRTVVLRDCNEGQRTLACHADVRSAKVREAVADPRGSWLFYDRERKLQLRLGGRLSLHVDDEIADSGWEKCSALGRACYNTKHGPGEHALQPAGAPSLISNDNDAQMARSHFTVLTGTIEFLDWLVISVKGHRRAQFVWRGEEWGASWTNP